MGGIDLTERKERPHLDQFILVCEQGLEFVDRLVHLTTPHFRIGEPEPVAGFTLLALHDGDHLGRQVAFVALQKELGRVEEYGANIVDRKAAGREQIEHGMILTTRQQQLDEPFDRRLLNVGSGTCYRCSPRSFRPIGSACMFGDITKPIQRFAQLGIFSPRCHHPLRKPRHGLHRSVIITDGDLTSSRRHGRRKYVRSNVALGNAG